MLVMCQLKNCCLFEGRFRVKLTSPKVNFQRVSEDWIS